MLCYANMERTGWNEPVFKVLRRFIHLLISQRLPVKPSGQLQVKPLVSSIQMPPFIHESGLQSFMSGRSKNMEYEQ